MFLFIKAELVIHKSLCNEINQLLKKERWTDMDDYWMDYESFVNECYHCLYNSDISFLL